MMYTHVPLVRRKQRESVQTAVRVRAAGVSGGIPLFISDQVMCNGALSLAAAD